eukprot:CAMPEP_0206230390 /NCGR_PEP_ID=MMETSP0047_2-20121206/10235_1 /ASSEMBLY_ACC=CAM_ASM_000192 /TAXON_ID=195065 /ORGANISM="Chroomonas mesostigmatica_cf, Strain CCMP1168" /LENGTH=526 /DNA_ID=CAMNT_0053653813 /DNA_START=232 /DNA_END=1812 /DNA_ORIENTATION=+
MAGDSRKAGGSEARAAVRAALVLAIAASPAMGAVAGLGGKIEGAKSTPGSRGAGWLAGAARGSRSGALGFAGPVGGLRGAMGWRGAAAISAGPKNRPLVGGAGAGAAVRGLRASSVIDEDPHMSLASESALFTVPSSAEFLSNCASTSDMPSALPYLGGEAEHMAGLDSVLKGIKVGHGIRYSRHPKAVFPEQPALSDVVQQLHDVGMKAAVSAPSGYAALDFTFNQIQQVREEVERGHSMSERKLSALGHLLMERFAGHNRYQITSMATAESKGNVFTLSENIPLKAIDQGADSAELAREQLDALSVDGEPVSMSDHSIEFGAEEWNEWGVHRIIAHSRPARDLWKVIADSLFGLEHPEVERFVDDDMYHLKIVVEDVELAEHVHRSLRNIEWTDTELRARGIPAEASTRKGQLVEQTTHSAEALGHAVQYGESNGSGDRCSTVRWWGAGIQVRVQTLNEHYAETEMITMANREKLAKRKELHQERLAAQSPLYGFARNLMRWMLDEEATTAPPACGRIQVTIHD